MTRKKLNPVVALAAAALAATVGCSTVRRAQETQAALEAKGAGAAAETGGKLDLRGRPLSELVAFALTNRPSVAAARLAVEDARLALREIDASAPLVSATPWTAPGLSLGGGYSASSESDNRLRFKTEGKASAALSLDLLVYDFGRHEAAAAAAREQVIASELECVRIGYDVFGEVAGAYFTLLENDALYEVSLTNRAVCAMHMERAVRQFEEGETKQLDVLRARLDVAKAEELTVSASNAMMTAGATLMRALGVDASRGSCGEVYGYPPDCLASVMRGFADTRYDAESAFAFARTNSPAVRVARARLRAASDRVDGAVADLLPQLSVSASLSFTDPLWWWNWGVSASQSLFQGFRKTTAVDRSVVALREAAVAVDEAEQELSLAIELAIEARDNASEARRTARTSVREARENLAMVVEQYALGDASRVDFTDSLNDYVTALGNRVSAFYRGQLAETKLFAVMGQAPEYVGAWIREDGHEEKGVGK